MISNWLLSIAGVVLLSVLSEFVLPEGQINRYIRVIFSFIILLVIILPLPQIFKKDFNLSDMLDTSESTLQEDYLYQVNLDKLTAINQQLSISIQREGLENVEVSINANILTDELEIYSVYVDLSKIEFNENFESKDISKAKVKIRELINEISLLNGVEVKFNEQS